MPSPSSGTSAVPVTTLFAHSGAATPSTEPLPNSSGCFDQRFASLYERKAAIVPPAPGVTPSKVPIAAPIACGRKSRRHVRQSGSLRRAARASTFAHAGSIACTISSVTAKRPTITTIGRMPPRRSGEPKVNRATPETGSVPIVAIMKPMIPAISPFSSDLPDSPAMTLRPSTPSAK